MDTKAKTDGSLALQENKRRVITIEATKTQQTVKLRVAAYTRVSSSSEDQLNSYSAQNRYYTEYITSHEQWTLVDIYADEGITGTSAEKREDFQRLLADCRKGKIDRVITKSISRFARNTKECLEAVRELKSHGISVCFEEQKIDTAAMSSEMITAIFASIAQRESETISQNLRWSYQNQMKSGTFVPTHQPFGYLLKDGKITINEEEATVVRKIYSLYLSGYGVSAIAQELNELSHNNPVLQRRRWEAKTVSRILKNERYAGCSLWQKTYRTNTFPKQDRINHGELPQYYVENTHPPIVSEKDYRMVQVLICKNAVQRRKKQQSNQLKQNVVCGICKGNLRRKIINDKAYWNCIRHDLGNQRCNLKPVLEAEFYHAFCCLHYKLKCHPEILTQMVSNLQAIRNHRMLWSVDVIGLNKRISEITSQAQMLTVLKQQGLVDPDIFISKSNELTEQLRKTKLEKERLLDTEQDEVLHRTQELIEILEHEPDFTDGFDEELFGELIDKIIVESNERLIFRLKNGLELTESIERTVR